MFSQWFGENLVAWMQTSGVTVLSIIVGLLIINFFSGKVIGRIVRRMVTRSQYGSETAELKREDTLIRIFKTTADVVLWTIGLIMIIAEFGIDIAPLIAGAGLVGVAIGFGAQYLVRDIISGLFIILENQYRVGDTVDLVGISGSVEDITLRKTVLRDLDGTLHHIPNGEIKTASNMSKDFARINLDIGVAYESDLAHVESVVNRVGENLATDSEWKDRIIEPPLFVRITRFEDSALTIKILGKVYPQEQWAVAGELRKRLKIAFDEEGIDIPYPHQVIKQIS